MSIDPAIFSLENLVDKLLHRVGGDQDPWRCLCEIVPAYMPPHPRPETRPRCVIRFDQMFLRYSCGPSQGYFWDMYGDDFISPELALLALSVAPSPPGALKEEVWQRFADQKRAIERAK